jgi:hypothetical protein
VIVVVVMSFIITILINQVDSLHAGLEDGSLKIRC